jgi:hypothetical protein
MPHDDRRRRHESGSRPRRRRPPELPRRSRSRLPLIVLAIVCPIVLLGLVGVVIVGYFVLGVEKSSDPVEIQAALDSMGDVTIPTRLNPHTKTVEATGVESVEFRSASGDSYLRASTGKLFNLGHSGSLRDAKDQGKSAAGGKPEQPAAEEIIKATVRGQPAEFIYRRYSTTETVSGYFQGKKFAVHLEAELSLREFSPGTAAALARSIK